MTDMIEPNLQHLDVAFKKKHYESKQSLSKTGKLLSWAGEDHPAALSDCEDEDAFFGSLDFFASFFGQAKNEEPSRLEAKRRLVELKVSSYKLFVTKNRRYM